MFVACEFDRGILGKGVIIGAGYASTNLVILYKYF